MTFEEEILDFSKDIIHKKRGITTEETTKIALVLPFLKKLGYDTENPDELKAEYAADVGVKKSEKVDFAVLIDGKVQRLFLHNKEFDRISCETLKKEGIIKGAPQSIQSLEHEKYLKLKMMIK